MLRLLSLLSSVRLRILSKRATKFSLVGFGSFEVRERAARTGRNPHSGEEMKIEAAKVPAFKAGRSLKDLVNGK